MMLGNLDEFREKLQPTEMWVTEGPPPRRAYVGCVIVYPEVSSSTVLCFHVENTFAFFL